MNIFNELTLIEKATRTQGAPGEVGAAANAIPKRTLEVECVIYDSIAINK